MHLQMFFCVCVCGYIKILKNSLYVAICVYAFGGVYIFSACILNQKKIYLFLVQTYPC